MIYNFRRRGVFRPNQQYVLCQIEDAIRKQEHIKDQSTIPQFLKKLKQNPNGGAYHEILYDTMDKYGTNQHMIPLQDALIKIPVKHIRSAVFVFASTSYQQHKNSIRARL